MNVAIIGSGVVGQATGKGLATKGHRVTFTDINPEVLSALKADGYDAGSPPAPALTESEVFMISVSTPTFNGMVGLEFLKSAAAVLGEATLKGQEGYAVVVVRSTVPPGTTEELVIPLLEKFSEKKAGQDFGVCMQPEYLRERSAMEDFLNPRMIVIGSLDRRSGEALEKVYSAFSCPIEHVSLREAEMQKYVHNLLNATKISFFNEMRIACETLGVNADKVFRLALQTAEAVWNPEYGTKNLGPYSGTCLPKDTRGFLSWANEHLYLAMPLLRAVIRVNEQVSDRRGVTV